MNTKDAQEIALEVANIILENLAPDEDEVSSAGDEVRLAVKVVSSQTNNDNSTSDDYITGDDGPDFTSELYSGEDFVTLNIAQTGTRNRGYTG